MPPPSLNALRQYATAANPSSSFPASVLLFANASSVVIFDAYPKAKYHFLILPQYPFPASSSKVKLEQLDDLERLLRTPEDVRNSVLEALSETAKEVEEMVKDEMVKTEGFDWRINIGFHSVPSMKHVHLHVISDDFISPSLKTKRHVNSFRPDLGFFLPLKDVLRWNEEKDTLSDHISRLSSAEAILKLPLECHHCGKPFDSIPKLKSHYDEEFDERRRLHSKKG